MPNTPQEHAQLKKIPAPLLAWFRQQARQLPWREQPTPYRVWISEIMLQQTRVAAVMPYFERFLAVLPDPAALAAADEDTLMKLWEGLGYYSRARNLQKAACILVEKYTGQLPAEYETLLTLPGIGHYTAGAISSIAYGKKHPAVDGNVLRVIMRLTNTAEDVLKETTKRAIEAELLAIMPDGQAAGDFNQALMELGALVCLPRGGAHCEACPLQSLCQASAAGTVAELPVKAPKKQRRREKRTVLRLCQGGRIAIDQRPARGLLAGLWELPNYSGHLSRKEVLTLLREAGLPVPQLKKLPPARHIFSHVEWELTGWEAIFPNYVNESKDLYDSSRPLPPLHWIKPAELEHTYSIPSAFHYYLFSKSSRNL